MNSRGIACEYVCAAKDCAGRSKTAVEFGPRASVAVCSRRSSVCCRRSSALLGRMASLGMRRGGRGKRKRGDAGVDLGKELLEPTTGRPVQEVRVGIAAGLFDGRRGTEHDGLEETNTLCRQCLFILAEHNPLLGGESHRLPGTRHGCQGECAEDREPWIECTEIGRAHV